MTDKLSQKYYRHRGFMRDLINKKDPSIVFNDYPNDIIVADHKTYGCWKYNATKDKVECFDLECVNIENYKQSTLPNDDWESTMEEYEVDFIMEKINSIIKNGEDDEYEYADSFRGARLWKRSQRKRFRRLRTCCGSFETIIKRYNVSKLRWDHYLIGFNYGH